MVSWYVCLCALSLVSSPHVAVVNPVSALALRLVVTLTSIFLFLHEALYETSDQLLVAADLPSFPTAHCRVAEDSRIQDADDVGCVCTYVLEREPRRPYDLLESFFVHVPSVHVSCPASFIRIASTGANGFRWCADLLYCPICAFLAISLSRYTSVASFGISLLRWIGSSVRHLRLNNSCAGDAV